MPRMQHSKQSIANYFTCLYKQSFIWLTESPSISMLTSGSPYTGNLCMDYLLFTFPSGVCWTRSVSSPISNRHTGVCFHWSWLDHRRSMENLCFHRSMNTNTIDGRLVHSKVWLNSLLRSLQAWCILCCITCSQCSPHAYCFGSVYQYNTILSWKLKILS
jgi:hypothetical protein